VGWRQDISVVTQSLENLLLIGPDSKDPAAEVKKFLDHAKLFGDKRFAIKKAAHRFGTSTKESSFPVVRNT
jgi:hypothetical protein